MNVEFLNYCIPNVEASWVSREGKRRLVAAIMYKNVKTRRAEMAHIQKDMQVVPLEQIIAHVNVFLDGMKDTTDSYEEEEIRLDGKDHRIIGNCIVVKECNWRKPHFNGPYDKKYDEIKQRFGLRNVWDVVWLKFAIVPETQQKHLGVVALGNDINFENDNSAGQLLAEIGLKWDESFVCIFPLTPEMLKHVNRRQLETGIGNYLIEKQVPIIDFYSHNNFD